MPTTPSNGQSEILKFAQEYQHNPNQHVVLEPHKEAILLLRAKYATYDTITQTLKQNGVEVSEASVRRFCRAHYVAIKQIQAETNRKRREIASASPTASSSSSGTTRSSFSESHKPGPKIARDDL